MQTQFKLSADEVQQACQLYVARENRARNIKVTSVQYNAEDSTIIVGAETVAQPAKPRAKKGEGKAAQAKKQA